MTLFVVIFVSVVELETEFADVLVVELLVVLGVELAVELVVELILVWLVTDGSETIILPVMEV